MTLTIVVEGETDLPIARKLALSAGFDGTFLELPTRGKARLDARLPNYAEAARRSPWLVLRDLDHDAPCAPTWLMGVTSRELSAEFLSLRIAVRQVESWLLADREAFSRFFGVPVTRLPNSPDREDNAKLAVVNLARGSKKRGIVSGIVPAAGSSVRVGPLYESLLIEFGTAAWDIDRAAHHSESLRRAQHAMIALAARWHT